VFAISSRRNTSIAEIMSQLNATQQWDPEADLEIHDRSQHFLTCSGTCTGWERSGQRCRWRLNHRAAMQIKSLIGQIGAMRPRDVLGHSLLEDLAWSTLCEGPQTDEARNNTQFRGHRSQNQVDWVIERWNKIITDKYGPRNDSGYSSPVHSSPSRPRQQAVHPPLRPVQTYQQLPPQYRPQPFTQSYVISDTSSSAPEVRYPVQLGHSWGAEAEHFPPRRGFLSRIFCCC
jgi:hypothetical protein